MHVYFSGIGGGGIGPLALIAYQAGFQVSGSDQKDNLTVKYLREHGVRGIHVGQEYDQIAAVHEKQPIDWFVYTSALPMDQPDAPELRFCQEHGIKATKRDEFLSFLLRAKNLSMIAVAGTHGKTTTTAMAIWLFKQLGLPVSYSVAARLSFGDMGAFDPKSTYFVYEADEYDRNFLAYQPALSIITGIDWDHPDIYPTREAYHEAFRTFLGQSKQAALWDSDVARLELPLSEKYLALDDNDTQIDEKVTLPGRVNRLDAWLVAHAVARLTGKPLDELFAHLNRFPGVARRFERIVPGRNLYTDTAHTPAKIRGALQLAHEVAGDNVVVVYEGLHNTRQHFIKDELKHLFDGVKKLYVVPTYLAREDVSLPLLKPKDIIELLDEPVRSRAQPAELNANLATAITKDLAEGDTVLALSDGGGSSLDEWLRETFAARAETQNPSKTLPSYSNDAMK
jgi:UDP-N-acetylmuramate--alanine ligase